MRDRPVAAAGAPGLAPELRGEFLHLVEQHFGIRNSDYISQRLDAAVADLLPRTSCADAEALLETLRADGARGWRQALAEHLTVGETYFFRDPALVTALRTLVLPEMMLRRATDRRLRIWSAGCSTGEEPYTIAILLQQQSLEVEEWDVQLVGTDVNRVSLGVARDGVYSAWSFRAVAEEFRGRYFRSSGRPNAWQLEDRVRGLVRFAWNNLAADPVTPPLADIDLIVCRNVTIYFDAATTQRLYRALIDALAPGGWLVLGPSDPLPSHPHRLERIEAADTVLWRRPGAERSTPEARRPGAGGSTPESRRPPTSSARRLPASRSVPSMCAPAPVQASAPRVAPPAADRSPAPLAAAVADDDALRAGLLALESGSYASAVHWLRQATFRDPNTPLGQLALARAYLGSGDTSRAQAALVYADRLLADLGEDNLAPGSETLSVATLRQTVQTHLARLPRP